MRPIVKYRDILTLITVEPIEMTFGMWTRVGTRKRVLHGAAYWHHLANTIEPSICGGEGTFCQITLSTCLSQNAVRLPKVVQSSRQSVCGSVAEPADRRRIEIPAIRPLAGVPARFYDASPTRRL